MIKDIPESPALMGVMELPVHKEYKVVLAIKEKVV